MNRSRSTPARDGRCLRSTSTEAARPLCRHVRLLLLLPGHDGHLDLAFESSRAAVKPSTKTGGDWGWGRGGEDTQAWSSDAKYGRTDPPRMPSILSSGGGCVVGSTTPPPGLKKAPSRSGSTDCNGGGGGRGHGERLLSQPQWDLAPTRGCHPAPRARLQGWRRAALQQETSRALEALPTTTG